MKFDKKTNFYELRKLAVKTGLKLGEHYNDSDSKIIHCSDRVKVFYDTSKNKFNLQRYRCKDRFCPICNHVKSTKLSTYLNGEYSALRDDFYIISLTLTCKNVSLYDLKHTQQCLYDAFRSSQKIWRYRLGKEYAGIRTYEVTYNRELDTWHPHFHCLLVFPKSIPLWKIESYDFGGVFAAYLPDGLCGYSLSPQYFGSHVVSSTKQPGFHKSVTWNHELYDPSKSTLFEFTKYVSKFKLLIENCSDSDFHYFYDIMCQVKVHSMYGAWRGYLKQMNEEYLREIYSSAEEIIQNANSVYIGSITFSARDIVAGKSFSFSKNFYPSKFTPPHIYDRREFFQFVQDALALSIDIPMEGGSHNERSQVQSS